MVGSLVFVMMALCSRRQRRALRRRLHRRRLPLNRLLPKRRRRKNLRRKSLLRRLMDLTFTTVVKIAGINWFNRMEEGVKEFGCAETGINASLVGPAQAAAQQIPIIEDLIAQGVDALLRHPHGPGTADPVLQKAMDAGIVVVTHEASNQQSMHFDIEAFDNRPTACRPDGPACRADGRGRRVRRLCGQPRLQDAQRMGGWGY